MVRAPFAIFFKLYHENKNGQGEGAQKLRNEAYIEVCRLTKLAAQRSRWTFFNSR